MIIKRRVTREFVQLANDVVRDQRISLEAHGILHYLLSLPNDWEVNLRHIEKFWSIGARKRKRIFRELRDVGWVRYEKLKSEESGDYIGSRWVICDEPGEAPQEIDEIEAQELNDSDEGEQPTATKTDSGNDPDAASRPGHDPPDAQRGGREARRAQNSTVESRKNILDEDIDSTNTPPDAAREDDDAEPPPTFGALLRLWPMENVVSAWACEKLFATLGAKHKRDAGDGIKPYLADCRSKGQNRLCDLKTYLYERRWEKFTGSGIRAATSGFFLLKAGMPQTERWRNHLREAEPSKLRFFERQIRTGQAYAVQSEWPPAKGALTPSDHESLADL